MPTIAPTATRTAPPNQGRAPELTNDVWINSDRPLRLADLQAQGKVVLVDFWTFGCVNCVRTVPSLKVLHDKYKDQGLVIVGVHSPEFDYERNLDNVQQAVQRLGIAYPVAIDNEFQTWNAYHNRYWPQIYFVDKQGYIRDVHIGELHLEDEPDHRTERLIEQLLAE